MNILNVLTFSACATVAILVLAAIFMAVEKLLGVRDTSRPAPAHKPLDIPDNN